MTTPSGKIPRSASTGESSNALAVIFGQSSIGLTRFRLFKIAKRVFHTESVPGWQKVLGTEHPESLSNLAAVSPLECNLG